MRNINNGKMMRYVQLILVCTLLFTIGCSKKAEKTYLDAAEQKMKADDITGAIEEYNKFLEDYPQGTNTPKVLFDLGKIYQSRMDKNVEGDASLLKSIEYYNQVAQKFPTAKEAPPALFMVAFITANELKKYDEAREVYRKFLKLYPKHELADDAQSEIETVGMSPEEIIIRKELAGK